MFNKKPLLLRFGTVKAASFKKKLAVLFIVTCMAINGFVPSTASVSKYSFFMVFAAATQNAVVKVFSKCNDSLVVMSNMICREIYDFIFSVPAQQASETTKHAAGKKDNSSDDNTVVVEKSTITETRRVIVDQNDKVSSVFVFTAKLFKLYMKYKIPDESAALIIVLFLVLMLAVRQRKDIEEGLKVLSRENKEKIRISA